MDYSYTKSLSLLAAGGALALGLQFATARFAGAAAPRRAATKSVAHHRQLEADGSWAESPGEAQLHATGRGTRVFRVAMTGGPCGGKSSSLAALTAALALRGRVRDRWWRATRDAVVDAFRDAGKGWYNLNEADKTSYDFSKMKTFLTATRLKMEDALRSLYLRDVDAFSTRGGRG